MSKPVSAPLHVWNKPVDPGTSLPYECLETILAHSPPSFLYQTLSLVSRDFRQAAGRVLHRLHGVQLESSAYPPYTKIAHKFCRLVQAACQGKSHSEAYKVLDNSRAYRRVRDVLTAEFGYCIRRAEGVALEFHLRRLPFDMLNNEKKVAVLPFYLDLWNYSEQWFCSIKGLVRRRRFDLLKQLQFPKIEQKHLLMLIEAKVPASVVECAMESFRNKEPDSELLGMLAFTGFGNRKVPLCPDWKVPVFVLHYLHQANRVLPENNVLVDGLKGE